VMLVEQGVDAALETAVAKLANFRRCCDASLWHEGDLGVAR
jgi:hypothetical protein